MTLLFTAHSTTLLRSLILDHLVKFGTSDLASLVREKFKRHCDGLTVISAEEQSFVYQTMLAADGKNTFNELMKVCVPFFET